MNDDLKEKLSELIWNFWLKNEVCFDDVLQYIGVEFQLDVRTKLEEQIEEYGIKTPLTKDQFKPYIKKIN